MGDKDGPFDREGRAFVFDEAAWVERG